MPALYDFQMLTENATIEKEYGTMPGNKASVAADLACCLAEANLTMEKLMKRKAQEEVRNLSGSEDIWQYRIS